MFDDKIKELKIFVYGLLVLSFIYWLPIDVYHYAIISSFHFLQEYIREHTLSCLVPAFFIAGGISSLVPQAFVIQYFTKKVHKIISYGVASVSGFILSVCSCTVLPLFSGIYKKGAGLGAAFTFLYSGPAINVLASILTFKILGFEFGIFRTLFAILNSILIGILMELIFYKESFPEQKIQLNIQEKPELKKIMILFYFVIILIFATWGDSQNVWYHFVYENKWYVVSFFVILSLISFLKNLAQEEKEYFISETWYYVKLIFPYLLIGVMVSGFLIGVPNKSEGMIPKHWIQEILGGDSIFTIFLSTLIGALFYFATLTEIPIIQSLLSAGMGKASALALLLSGPSISLPSILALRAVLGWKKTFVYSLFVIIFSTLAGILYKLLM